MKKVTVMIQARTGSTRFPKKTLSLVENKPMIWHIVNRLKTVKQIEQIALITTQKENDKVFLDLAKEEKIFGFAGDENDLLDRHFQCAKLIDADPIIRVTSDCPLIDPNVVERMLEIFLSNDYDYMSNVIKPSFPDGLDVEIFTLNALNIAVKNAKLNSEREHVFPYFVNNPQKFKLFNFENNTDLSSYRWTVDYESDLEFVREIYSKMKPKNVFFMSDILKILMKYPNISKINSGISRNEGYEKSLQTDTDSLNNV